jgi:DNA-binding transcriptional ArsR family regulator
MTVASLNAATLTALAEPNRFQIVEFLRGGPRPVGEIAERLRLQQPQASKHLRVLKDAGIVEALPVAQLRVYQLRAKPFKELTSWLDTFRPTWDERLDVMEEFLQELKAEPAKGRGK